VRGILEKHSSVIRMASEPDVGTTFWFDLPLAQSDQDEIRLQAERQSRFDQEAIELI
jgi:two-component system sensor histidine kinase NblS